MHRWSTARFPTRWLRGTFLDELERWSDVEGLPTVLVEPLGDGRSVRFWAADGRETCVIALARAYAGRLLDAQVA
jgi:hypothetical protein